MNWNSGHLWATTGSEQTSYLGISVKESVGCSSGANDETFFCTVLLSCFHVTHLRKLTHVVQLLTLHQRYQVGDSANVK